MDTWTDSCDSYSWTEMFSHQYRLILSNLETCIKKTNPVSISMSKNMCVNVFVTELSWSLT